MKIYKIEIDYSLGATVPLSRCGNYAAVVDRELLPLLAGRTWSLHHCGKGKLYARSDRFEGVKNRVYMHRLIALEVLGLPPGDGYVVDHINGCGLDNRGENLRWMRAFQNRWGTARHNVERVDLRSAAADIPF